MSIGAGKRPKTPMRSSARRFVVRLDGFELSLMFLLIVALLFTGWRWHRNALEPYENPSQSASELEAFRARYGPDHFSEREEEWMIRDYFRDRRKGFFVDVGANHYRAGSKTFYLESKLGWSGLAIEPQVQFAADYARYRPQTKFFPYFVSDKSNAIAQLYLLNRSSLIASGNKAFVERFGKPDEVREVPTITLTDLLDAEHAPHVDFLSMDIELHEPTALRGFDIERFKPSLVCVEALLPVRQQILNYFAAHRYVVVGKYVWSDLENMYFAPLDDLSEVAGR